MISNPKVTSDITRRMAACYGDRKQKEVGILRMPVALLSPSACSRDGTASAAADLAPEHVPAQPSCLRDMLPARVL